MTQPRDEKQFGLYPEGAQYLNEYDFEPGVCVLPVAEEPPTDPSGWSSVVVLRLHAPYRVRRVNYEAQKSNNPPIIPSPSDTGAFVFTGGSMAVGTSVNKTYCNFDWGVSCQYEFVENCASRVQDGFVLGVPPWKWAMSVTNMGSFKPADPQVLQGAIAQAGVDARIGYTMGADISSKITTPGGTTIGWGYNQASFLPGVLFSTDLINGGPTANL